MMMRPFTNIIFDSLLLLGEFTIFIFDTLKETPTLIRRRSIFFRHCEFIGVSSTPIIVVSAVFMGGVFGYQLYDAFARFGAEALLGGSVGIALFKELAPVMASVMVIGRAGSAMAAEIASMRISEQIDALEIMSVNPMEFLVTPRVFAALVMIPLLSIIYGAVGAVSAAGVACGVMGLSYATYWHFFTRSVDFIEIVHCVTKGAVFGLFAALVGCFCGFRASGGAHAVGLATRSTVVSSLLLVLFLGLYFDFDLAVWFDEAQGSDVRR